MVTTVGILEKLGDPELLICLRRAPLRYPGKETLVGLRLPLPNLQHYEDIVAYGKSVRDGLQSQPAISAALTAIFAAPDATPGTLQFDISSSRGEVYPWEAICDGFGLLLAVDRRFGLTRVVESDPPARVFDLPLRIAAFISAAGVSSETELNALIDAVEASPLDAGQLAVDVYLSETELIDETNARAKPGSKLEGIRAFPMPAGEAKFADALSARPAQILHFFCHGRLSGAIQALEFATIVGRKVKKFGPSAAPDPQETLFLPANKLQSILGARQAWLIVLNCCESAQASGPVYSMARNLVAQGAPACLGMSDPIASLEASRVTAAVYRKLLDDFAAMLAATPANSVSDIDFDVVGVAAREALSALYDRTSPKYARWLMPRLYSNSEGLRVQRVPIGADAAYKMQVRLQTVADYERTLSDPPIEAVQALVAILDQDPPVPQGVRPLRLRGLQGMGGHG